MQQRQVAEQRVRRPRRGPARHRSPWTPCRRSRRHRGSPAPPRPAGERPPATRRGPGSTSRRRAARRRAGRRPAPGPAAGRRALPGRRGRRRAPWPPRGRRRASSPSNPAAGAMTARPRRRGRSRRRPASCGPPGRRGRRRPPVGRRAAAAPGGAGSGGRRPRPGPGADRPAARRAATGPSRTPASHTRDAGSATTGSPQSRTSDGAPAPAITSVGAAGSSGSGAACTRGRATAVHGTPPGRPSGAAPPSGTSGSAKGRLTCTGPGGVPSAAATARPTAARHGPFSRSGSLAGPADSASRTASPKIPGWTTVWFAPVPISCGGRSAVRTSSGTPACDASSTAGCRFATAVPDVVTTGTGRPDRSARPSARKPAVRSSIRTCSRSRPAASAACSANASGALREPGHRTASVTPQRTSSSTITCAWAVEGFTSPRLGRDQLESRGEGRARQVLGPPARRCRAGTRVGRRPAEPGEVCGVRLQ